MPGHSSLFGYDASNQRVYQGTYNTSTGAYSNEQIYFYGADGKKLVAYSLQVSGGNVTITASQTKVWFAGRILAPQDRLQSQGKYFPYGEDRTNTTPANPPNDQEKFATYTQDSATGLDYAYQRFFNSSMGGFHTVDPFAGSANFSAPQSLNRYSYVTSDPVNYYDPSGLALVTTGVCSVGAEEGTESVVCELYSYSFLPMMSVLLWNDVHPPPASNSDIARSLQAQVKSGLTTDCKALASFANSMAKRMGDGASSRSAFVAAFGVLTPSQFPTNLPSTLTGISSSNSSVALNTGQASGYLSQYQNTTPDNPRTGWNGDQGHHFAAFFQIGFKYGASAGANLASIWEKLEGTPGNLGDISLGTKAALLGSEVASGQLNASQVGNAILNTLCKH